MKQEIVIRVDVDGQTVRASLAGMQHPDNVLEIYSAAHKEAMKLLKARGHLRRFRPPIKIRYIDGQGHVTMTLAESGNSIAGLLILEEPSSWSAIEVEDVRGRKARVRIEITP